MIVILIALHEILVITEVLLKVLQLLLTEQLQLATYPTAEPKEAQLTHTRRETIQITITTDTIIRIIIRGM